MSFYQLKKQIEEEERKVKERKDQEANATRQGKISSLIRIRRPEGYKLTPHNENGWSSIIAKSCCAAAKTCGAAVSAIASIANSQPNIALPELSNRGQNASPEELQVKEGAKKRISQSKNDANWNDQGEVTRDTSCTPVEKNPTSTPVRQIKVKFVNSKSPTKKLTEKKSDELEGTDSDNMDKNIPEAEGGLSEDRNPQCTDPKDPKFKGYKWVGNGYVYDVYSFDPFSDALDEADPTAVYTPTGTITPPDESTGIFLTPKTPDAPDMRPDAPDIAFMTPFDANQTKERPNEDTNASPLSNVASAFHNKNEVFVEERTDNGIASIVGQSPDLQDYLQDAGGTDSTASERQTNHSARSVNSVFSSPQPHKSYGTISDGNPVQSELPSPLPAPDENSGGTTLSEMGNVLNSALDRIRFVENANSAEMCDTLSSQFATRGFPLQASDIQSKSQHIKKGTLCSVAWSFGNRDDTNISLGKVTSVYRRKGSWKLNIIYSGIVGHKIGEEFTGTLPPHESVRVNGMIWHAAAPPCTASTPIDPNDGQSQGEYMFGQSAEQSMSNSKEGWKSKDLDYVPIPTSRVIKPEMISAVIASYREIMREYINSTYPQRHKIWHEVLSAMKYSLAIVRQASNRRRRRRPFEADSETSGDHPTKSDEHEADKRAIKKATRLVMEGCARKACKTLDQKFIPNTLSDDQILDRLKDLHPQHEYKFNLPNDAPLLTGLDSSELRSAGMRLVRGASPGPTGTTDSVVRLLIDDPVCSPNLCHMLMDLINGFLPRDLMKRLARSRLVAIQKTGGGIRPVAIGEVLVKLAGNILVQRYESTIQPLFAPMQQGVLSKSGSERIVHTLNERYRKGACILAIDLKNAFNTPSRNLIAKHVFGLATLRPFQRFFG